MDKSSSSGKSGKSPKPASGRSYGYLRINRRRAKRGIDSSKSALRCDLTEENLELELSKYEGIRTRQGLTDIRPKKISVEHDPDTHNGLG